MCATAGNDLPLYAPTSHSTPRVEVDVAGRLAAQIIDLCSPFIDKPTKDWDVLDCGCGSGGTTIELAKRCRYVKGIDPSRALYDLAVRRAADSGVSNVFFECIGASELRDVDAFDLVVLDNVLEHIRDQMLAFKRLHAALRREGILFVVVPNKLWPIEAHYGLPFLSYLPLPLANLYLRITRRGIDYSDACFAPTYWSLRKLLRRTGFPDFQFVVPSNLGNTRKGAVWYYRVGAWLLRHIPALWIISKGFVVVAKKKA